MDICQRLVLLAGQAPAATSVDAIERCIQLGALSDNDAYRNMVRFQNLLVHRYEHIDLDVLVTIVNRRLADFDQFRNEILVYVRNH